MIQRIIDNEQITEIFLEKGLSLHIEKNGQLKSIENFWASADEKERFIQNVISSLPKAPNYEHPLASGIWSNFRVQTAFPPAIKGSPLLQLRRLSAPVLYESLSACDWDVSDDIFKTLEQKFLKKENFLIVGPTGCGKTTLLKALLVNYCKNDRVICLEDTPELPKVNELSTNLQTFLSSSEEIPDVGLEDLIKASLRLRPDRLMMGEMRGKEAASFLLMLSTGHRGSGATLHADNAHDALRRLEMLVQMGEAHWGLDTVRRLIRSSLDFIICLARDTNGQRYIKSLSEVKGLEETGFLVHELYTHENLKTEEAFEF